MPPKQKDTLPPPPPSPSTKRPLPEVAQTSPAKKQTKWTADEDAKIIDLRGRGYKWEDISKELPGRSAISCRLHYQNYLERRSEWDEDRKNRLARLYERYAHKHTYTMHIHRNLCVYIPKHSGASFVHSHTERWWAQKHIPGHLYSILYTIHYIYLPIPKVSGNPGAAQAYEMPRFLGTFGMGKYTRAAGLELAPRRKLLYKVSSFNSAVQVYIYILNFIFPFPLFLPSLHQPEIYLKSSAVTPAHP